MKPGPSLNESKGAVRLRKLENSCVNVQLQILERQRNAQIMAEEAERLRGGN